MFITQSHVKYTDCEKKKHLKQLKFFSSLGGENKILFDDRMVAMVFLLVPSNFMLMQPLV